MQLLKSILKFIFESQNSSNWFEAIATFLAVLVALNKRTGITAYIRKDNNKYKLYINNLYYLPDSVKIIKCGMIFHNNRLQDVNVKKGQLNDLKNFQYISGNEVFNVPLFMAHAIKSTNNPYINEYVPPLRRNKEVSKICPFIVYFKDIHHHYYVLNYPSNKCKSYNWLSFKLKELKDYIRKVHDLIEIGHIHGENYVNSKDNSKEYVSNREPLKSKFYKNGFISGYKRGFKKQNGKSISYKKVQHIYNKYIKKL